MTSRWVSSIIIVWILATTTGRPQTSDDLVPVPGVRGAPVFMHRPIQHTTSTYQDFQGAVSPDGRWLVFVSDRSGNLDLWLRSLDPDQAAPDQPLTSSSASDTMPCWSPDGKSVAFVSNAEDAKGDIAVVGVRDRKVRRITDRTTGDSHPTWSPDGRTLVFAATRGNDPDKLIRIDLKSNERNALTSLSGRNPSFSPDGRFVAFDSLQDDPTGNIWVVAASGGTPTQVTSGATSDILPCFSGDGKRIFFVRFIDDTNGDGQVDTTDNPSIWAVPFRPELIKLLPPEPFPLTSSRTYSIFPAAWGNRVFYTANPQRGLDIWSLPQEGLLVLPETPAACVQAGRQLEDAQPPALDLATMVYRRCLRDFAGKPDAAATLIEAHYRLAKSLERLRDPAQASAVLQDLIRKNPGQGTRVGQAELSLRQIELDRATASVGDPGQRRPAIQDAVRDFDRLLQKSRADREVASSALLAIGQAWLKLPGDVEAQNRAVAAFDQVIRDYPDWDSRCAEAAFLRASVYEGLGKDESLIQAYIEVLKKYPQAKAWCQRASERIIELTVGSVTTPEERVQSLRRLVEECRTLSVLPALAQNQIGDIFYDQVESAKARRAYEAVVQDFPAEKEQVTRALFAQARICYEEQNYEQSLLIDQKIQQGGQAGDELLSRLARTNYIRHKLEKAEQALLRFGEAGAAYKEYEQLIQFDPEILEAHRGLVAAADAMDQAARKRASPARPPASTEERHPHVLQVLADTLPSIEKKPPASTEKPVLPRYVANYVIGLIYTYFEEPEYLDTAIDFLRKSVAQNSQVVYSHQTLGFCIEQKALRTKAGKLAETANPDLLQKAIEEYLQAMALNDENANEPAEISLLVNIGNGFVQLDELGQAYDYYVKAFRKFEAYSGRKRPPFDHSDRCLLFLERFGRAAFHQGELEQAELSFRQAMKLVQQKLEDKEPGSEARRSQQQATLASLADRLALNLQEARKHREAGYYFLLVRDLNRPIGNLANASKAARNAAYNFYMASQQQGEAPDEQALTLAMENFEENLKNVQAYVQPKKSDEGGGLITIKSDVGLGEGTTAATGFDKAGEERLLYTYIGKIHRESLDYPKAIQAYEQKLKLYPASPGEGEKVTVNTARAVILNQLGYFHFQLGRWDEAQRYLEESLALAEGLQSWPGRMLNAANLGYLAVHRLRLGESPGRDRIQATIRSQVRAIQWLRQPPPGTSATELQRTELLLLNHLGVLYHHLAREERSALRVVETGDTVSLISDSIRALEYAGASAGYFSRALHILESAESQPDESLWLRECALNANIAEVASLAMDVPSADEALQKAWAVAERYHLYPIQWKIRFQQARIAAESERTKVLKEAVDLLESAPPLDPFPAADHPLADALYRQLIDSLMRSGEGKEAFSYAERAQEQPFVAQATSRHYAFQNEEYRDICGAMAKALDELRATRREMSTVAVRNVEESALPEKYVRLRRQYETQLAEYRKLLAEAKEYYPELHALLQVSPVPAEEVQQLIPRDTAIIRYAVAGEKVVIWAITPDGFVQETAAMDRKWLPTAAGQAADPRALSDALLQPVARIAEKCPRAYIVPDPLLAEVPWESLPLPNGKRLIDQTQVAFLSSLNHYFFSYFKRSPHKKTLFLTGGPGERSEGAGRAPAIPGGGMVVDRLASQAGPEALLRRLLGYHAVQLDLPFEVPPGAALDAGCLVGTGLRRYREVQAARAITLGQPFSMTEYNKDLSSGLLVLSDVRAAEGFGGRTSIQDMARAFTFAGFPTLLVYLPRPGSETRPDPQALRQFIEQFYRLWQDRSAGDALRQAQIAASQAGAPADIWSRFRVLGHLGLSATEAHEFATVHSQQSLQAAVKARDKKDWPLAVRYFENALSLVEILRNEQTRPVLYRNLALCAFQARDLAKAVIYGEQQVELLRKGANQAALAQALFDLGVIYNEAERYQDGIRPLEEAAELFQKLGLKKQVFSTLGELGNVQQFAGEYLQSIQSLHEAMNLGTELGDEMGVGNQLRLIGAVYYRRLDDNARAEEYFRRAMDLFRKQADEAKEDTKRIEALKGHLRCVLDIGLIHERRADFDKAIECYEDALARSQQSGQRRLESEALMNIGNSHWFQGNYQKAFEFQRRSLAVSEALGDTFRQEVALNTAGLIYWTLNDHDRAMENLQRALKLAQALPGANGRIEVASTHNNIGLVLRSQGQNEAAIEQFRKAMDIDQALQSDWGMAYDERNIGMTYLRMGKLEEAEKSLRSAAERSHSIGDTTNLVKALASLGNALADQGKREAAEESFRQAVDLAGKANIREIVWRGEQGLGRIALAAKDRSTAHGHFKTAIEVVEQMRAAIKIEEFKNGFALNKLDLYEDMILLLLDEGRIDEAFSYSERSRARNFIDLLGNQKVKVARDQDREFLEKQVAMKREITRLEEASLSADTSTKEKAEKDLHDALRRYEDLLIETRLKNPELTAFVSVTPLAVRDVQSLLEPGVALLEYLVAQNEIVCWVITRDKLVVRRTPCPADDLRQKVSTYRKLMQSISDFKEEGRALFDLLIRPILADIEGALYVGIIPHDHLHYLSFASLTDGESYLIERVPLFHVPSASVLKFSFARRQQAKNRTVLGIGNPDLGNDALELPFAEKEVDAIRWSFPNIEILKREAATEKALIDKGSQYGIIHIGSHGEFDPVNPLASRILLAREGETDGSLEVDEIFQLTLQADLVVLSACQSGLGKVEKGDEVIGMNRAFTYAGTHSLLSTLWRVNDVTTAILVKHFYRNYATEDKASSLRKAQLLVKRYYPHPSYWAAFVLTGDYQ